MSYLNLPGTKHPLGVLDNLVERKLFLEVIAAGEMAANLLHRDRGDDGAIRESGLRCRFYQASSSELFGKVVETPQLTLKPSSRARAIAASESRFEMSAAW